MGADSVEHIAEVSLRVDPQLSAVIARLAARAATRRRPRNLWALALWLRALEVAVGTGGKAIVAGGGLGQEGLVEMLSEGVKRDLATAAELGLSQTAAAEIVEEGIPA